MTQHLICAMSATDVTCTTSRKPRFRLWWASPDFRGVFPCFVGTASVFGANCPEFRGTAPLFSTIPSNPGVFVTSILSDDPGVFVTPTLTLA
eukprot:3938458-Rhodomonas_salina.2